MIPERTELEWTYRPADLFEAPYRYQNAEYDLLVEAEKAVATLRVARDPVEPQLEETIRKLVESVCAIRQLQVHRKYDVEGPRVYQHADGRKHVAIRIEGSLVVAVACQADIVVTDADGNVVRDTRAERIAEQTSQLELLAPELAHSSPLRSIVASYSKSVSDPGNELVHLYEVRDALAAHYGGEEEACAALNIARREWQRLGILANVEPLEEGRHRGKHAANRRPATESELQQARGIVCRWIIAFGRAQ